MKRFLLSIAAILCLAGGAFAQIPELKPVKDLDEQLMPTEKKGKWGFANVSGKMIIKAVFDEAGQFVPVTSADGTTMQVARVKADGRWGYITRENVYLIEPEYDAISDFDSNATVIAESGPFKALIGVRSVISPRLGIPVLTGSILQLNLSEIGEFSAEGLALASRAGKYGMLNTKGAWAVACRYDSIDINPQGGFDVILEGKYGILKADGAILVEPIYDSIVREPSVGGYLVSKDGLFGIVGEDGHRIAPPSYEQIRLDKELGLLVWKNGLEGILSMDGRIILQTRYASIARCSQGYLVNRDGMNGIVSQGDKVIVDYGKWTASPEVLLADDITSLKWNAFREVFFVEKDGLSGVLDAAGNELVGFYPWATDLSVVLDSGCKVDYLIESLGMLVIEKDGLYGLMSLDGTVVRDPEFDSLYLNEESTLIEVTKDGKYGLLDGEGNTVMPCEYDSVPDPNAPPVEEEVPAAVEEPATSEAVTADPASSAVGSSAARAVESMVESVKE